MVARDYLLHARADAAAQAAAAEEQVGDEAEEPPVDVGRDKHARGLTVMR
jgi:hypothetical protein